MKKFAAYVIMAGCMALFPACHNHSGHDHDHDHDHESAEEHGHDHDHGHEGEEEEHHHDGAIIMEAEKAAAFGIATETFSPGTFAEVIKVSGRIEPAPSDRMTVTARKSGIFTLAHGITPGCSVGAGALIGTISTKGVQGGDVNSAARIAAEAAKRELDRLTPLYKDGLVTAADYNAAERAYKEALALAGNNQGAVSGSENSPCAGTLTDIFVSSGQYVEVGTPIASVAKNSQLTLRADVPEKFIAHIGSVTTANFRPDYSDKTFLLSELDGKKISSETSAAARNGYIPLYFSFRSNGETLPGAYAEIYLKGAPKEGAYTLPRTALVEMQGNKYVYVCRHGHAYEKKVVATGASDGERVEILSGIEPGDEVVTKGATIVRMAETSAIAPPGHTHNH